MLWKKYEILRDNPVSLAIPGSSKVVTVYPIRALRDFTTKSREGAVQIKRGDRGGYVQFEKKNLSQRNKCWVFPGAAVIGDAVVCRNATARGTSSKGEITTFITDNALLGGSASVVNSGVMEKSGVTDNAMVIDSTVYGLAIIGGMSLVSGSNLYAEATINGQARVRGSKVCGRATVTGKSAVSGGATVAGCAVLTGSTEIIGPVRITGRGVIHDCRMEKKNT